MVSDLFKTLLAPIPHCCGMSERDLRALPNVGPAMARTLMRLGVERPEALRGQSAEALFQQLATLDGAQPDPCVLDTFTAVVDHANGAPPRPWWFYSRERKAHAGGR
jgi:hypothetical protein